MDLAIFVLLGGTSPYMAGPVKMLKNRPEDALGSLVETVEIV